MPAEEGALLVAKEKVADLKKQLQTAELQEALLSKTATINGLCLLENICNSSLGQTISTEVLLEDKPVKALVDTWSPVNIVSIDCLLEVLLNKYAADQSPEDWRNKVTAKIQSPSLTIRSYESAKVNVICQLTVPLALGDWRCQVAILVQKGATMDLLLGMDALPLLGFRLLKRPCKDEPGIDMMKVEEKWGNRMQDHQKHPRLLFHNKPRIVSVMWWQKAPWILQSKRQIWLIW